MIPHPEWLKSAAGVLRETLEKDCDEKRKWMMPFWKRAEYYWNDIQDLWYDPMINDLRTVESTVENEVEAMLEANKIVQVYRPYGESIIAAATSGNLSFKFYPHNADAALDIDKALSFNDKATYVQLHNNITGLRRRAFTTRWLQGLVGSYCYFKTDKQKYGSQEIDELGEKASTTVTRTCANPECKERIDQQVYDTPEELAEDQAASPISCPNCGGSDIKTEDVTDTTPVSLGKKDVAKGCTIIDVFSPIEMIVPFYAKKPEDIDYVVVKSELHYAKARSLYPDYAANIQAGQIEQVEGIERAQSDTYTVIPSKDLVTITRLFCKPNQYYILFDPQKTEFDQLNVKYPDGLFATFINTVLVDCQNQDFDAHWTFLDSPLDSHVHCRPLGNAVIPIQDMENDLAYLTLDTIKHAVGETFYDQRLINSEAYKRVRSRAGNMVPINNPMPSKSIGEFFYSTKNATLSQEVDRFSERLEAKGQLASGAFPSVFGGQFSEGSKTLGVYEQSRNAALQRTSMPASDIDMFLAKSVYKATEIYDKNMMTDETYSAENGDSYKNITMRKSPKEAKIGRVEVMKSEQFPMTFEQQRAFIMELFGLSIEPINSALLSTQNLGIMDKVISIPGLKVPGLADKNKQLGQIEELLKGKPIIEPLMPGADPAMQPPPMPSVLPDKEIDNHDVCIATIIEWAVSPIGIRTKKMNPEGYSNVIAQLMLRKMFAMEMQQSTEKPPGEEEPEGEEPTNE